MCNTKTSEENSRWKNAELIQTLFCSKKFLSVAHLISWTSRWWRESHSEAAQTSLWERRAEAGHGWKGDTVRQACLHLWGIESMYRKMMDPHGRAFHSHRKLKANELARGTANPIQFIEQTFLCFIALLFDLFLIQKIIFWKHKRNRKTHTRKNKYNLYIPPNNYHYIAVECQRFVLSILIGTWDNRTRNIDVSLKSINMSCGECHILYDIFMLLMNITHGT